MGLKHKAKGFGTDSNAQKLCILEPVLTAVCLARGWPGWSRDLGTAGDDMWAQHLGCIAALTPAAKDWIPRGSGGVGG